MLSPKLISRAERQTSQLNEAVASIKVCLKVITLIQNKIVVDLVHSFISLWWRTNLENDQTPNLLQLKERSAVSERIWQN